MAASRVDTRADLGTDAHAETLDDLTTSTTPAPAPAETEGPFSGPAGRWFAVAVGVVLVIGLALRFICKSPLWEDEAINLAISRRPLGSLHQLLKNDGAPPLYYALEHFWITAFGTSDTAVRSLSGLIGVITLPVAWLAGRRLGGADKVRGQWVAWSAVVVLAASPFAIRYSTEARMYHLMALLGILGYLAIANAMEKPGLRWLAAVAAVTAALLYTQYWAFYLVASVGLALLWLAWRGVHRALPVLGAVVVGALAFAPWVPTFLYQAQHTGTPWAEAVTPAEAMFVAFGGYGGFLPGVTKSSLLQVARHGLVIFVLVVALLAVFGIASGRYHVDLDLRTRPAARGIAWATIATLCIAAAMAWAAPSAFEVRYTAVVFGLFALLVAYGITVLPGKALRYGALGVVVVLGFGLASDNIRVDRTQAGDVARALSAHARPGDVVAYCPDQLGVAVSHLFHRPGVQQYTFPMLAKPELVDWSDYNARNERFHKPGIRGNLANNRVFAQEIMRRAGDHAVWYVWTQGYHLRDKCTGMRKQFASARPRHRVLIQPKHYTFEREGLDRYGVGKGARGG